MARNVTHRNPDGTTNMRMGSKPGSRIALGSESKVVGYDVTYRYRGAEHTVRMEVSRWATACRWSMARS